MARSVILGNGQLAVGLNESGLVHDFYYPYVGLDNLTTARSAHHKIGVWVDGAFSWVDDGTWDVSVDFETDAMISKVRFYSSTLGVELLCSDFVDNQYNAFCRQMIVKNVREHQREIRVFMHQVFQISRAGRADTALYVPDEHYILDYKGQCSLLIYGRQSDGTEYDQYSVGNYAIEGKEGTYRDAEDGELTNNAVEHGGVDSVIRFTCEVEAQNSKAIDYWVIAADSQTDAEKVHLKLKESGLNARLAKNREHWREWFAVAEPRLARIDPEYVPIVKKSLLVIKAHTDKRGGIIASCDSSIYNYGRDYYSYVWPRDGAYVIWPLIRMGYTQEPKKFFEFCRDIITKEGYLRHKYQPDRSIGSTWHPLVHGKRKELAIQEDETAIVLFMLGEYYAKTNDESFVYSLYSTLVQPAADFMADFIDEQTGLPHASYDLWEEKFLTSAYTTACTYEGLRVAAEFAEMFNFPDDAARWRDTAERIASNSSAFFDPERNIIRKGFLLQEDGSLAFDNTLDISSMYGTYMIAEKGFIEADERNTISAIESILLDQSPSGGTPRYEMDNYFVSTPQYMGNPWFVATLWMAQYYVRRGNIDRAKHYMQWAMDKTLPSGVFSEQINPTTSEPASVAPLVWSHAEFINTALDIERASRHSA